MMTSHGIPPTAPASDSGRAAPAWRRIGTLARLDVRLLLRNGEQVLLTVLLPLLLLIGLSVTDIVDVAEGSEERVDAVLPGVIALAVLSTAFTAQAIGTAYDRRYGVLRLIGIGPAGRSGFIAAKCLSTAALSLGQSAMLVAVGMALGWRPNMASAATMGWLITLVVLGAASFTGLALLLAGTLRAEATLALANLVYVLLLLAGGVILAADRYPDLIADGIGVLPSAALADALRAVLQSGTAPQVSSLVILVLWAVLGGALAGRFFRWA